MKKTLQNLAAAFVGESQARNRYSYYSKIAKKEGYEVIAEVFALTAEQEKVHAKREFEHIQKLKGKNEAVVLPEVEVPVTYGNTKENLKAAMAGEKYEYTEMYPEFAKVAREEGFDDVAKRFASISLAEKHHEERFGKLLEHLEKGTMFKRSEKVWWICRECGYVHFGAEAPKECPSCDHPQAYYQFKNEDY